MAKVLVIDDNRQLNELLKDVVESWNHEVLVAEEGRTGVDLAQNDLPDIVLLDVMLPGLSGYEVCQILKRDTRTANIAVIMMSALSDVEDKIHGFRVGADNFLVKPVNYKELQAIINKTLKFQATQKSMELRSGVMETIHNLLRLIADKDCLEHIEQVSQYAGQLGINMNLGNEELERVQVTVILQHLLWLKGGEAEYSMEQIEKVLEPLRLLSWLRPVLEYVDCFEKGVSTELRQELMDKQLLLIADTVSLINRFVSLTEEEGDEDVAILRFKREGEEQGYNKVMVKRLAQIIEDEKVLQNI